MINQIWIQTKTAQTAPYNGSAVSVITVPENYWTLVLEIMNQTPNTTTRFTFEDSVDGFTSDIMAGPSFSVTGQIGDGSGSADGFHPDVKRYTITQNDYNDLRIGVVSSDLRLCVTDINGNNGSPSVVFQSWIEF